MDWANEHYVRAYTRDTNDILEIGWQGRAIWWPIIRRADMSGVVSATRNTLHELIRMPADVTATGLEAILKQKMMTEHDSYFFIPNHLRANTTPRSDKARQRESRERRCVLAALDGVDVTSRHAVSRAVTPSHKVSLLTPDTRHLTQDSPSLAQVTNGHEASQQVTASHGVSSPKATALDFDAVYSLYPRKQGKAGGLKKLRATVRTKAEYAALLGAIEKMAKLWDGSTAAQLKFCPQFSTFVNQQRWLDDELPTPDRGVVKHAAAPTQNTSRGQWLGIGPEPE